MNTVTRMCVGALVAAVLAAGNWVSAQEQEEAWGDDGAGSSAPKGVGLPFEVHCGSVLEVERRSDPVAWRDMDKVLAMKHLKPTSDEGEDTVIRRPPKEGKSYVIVTMLVKPKRSVGKYDYVIKHDKDMSPCLALTWGDNPFDERNWQGVPKTAATEVRLLFELPEEQEQGDLTFALPISLAQKPVPISFAKAKAAAPPPDKAEAPGGDDAKKGDAAGGEAKGDDAPAAKPAQTKKDDGAKQGDAAAKKPPAKKAEGKKPEGEKAGPDKKAADAGKNPDAGDKPAPANKPKAKLGDDWF